MLDARGCIIYCNLSLAKILGTSREAVIGRFFHDFLTPADQPVCQKLLREVQIGSSEGEMRLRLTDGSLIPASFSFCILSRDKTATGVLITDLSVQKQQVEFASRLQNMQDEERKRIARELHDVVAHDVSVIAIQAGAARAVQATRPEAAANALGLIETTARETLIELNRLLGVLRSGNGASPDRSPQPGIGQLAALVEGLRAAGLEVDARVDGEPRSLPPAVDLSAYRIVQEATTNVLKHARARRVDIRVHYAETMLGLDIRDDGAGDGSDPTSSSGHGLIGMRERVALFGGELETGRNPAGGFSVHARLPLEPAP